MTWRLAHSLDGLRDEVNDRWPGRSKVSDGTLGDTAHANRVSDHNPDGAGVVRAIDLTKWEGPTGEVAETVAETIRASRDPRVKYVIWRGRMFASYSRSYRKAWEWGPYDGPNGHFQHVHVSVLPGSEGDRPGPWGVYPLSTPPEEDDMPFTADEIKTLARAGAAEALDAFDKRDDTSAVKRLRGVNGKIDRSTERIVAHIKGIDVTAGDGVDVPALAAAIREGLGDAVADELAVRLRG